MPADAPHDGAPRPEGAGAGPARGRAGGRDLGTAIGLVLLSALAAVSMHGIVRHLGQSLHPFQIAFLRFALGGVILLPWLMRAGRQALATSRIRLHLLRAVLNAAALLCFFTALTLAPLAQLVALNFTAPLFASLLAIVMLRERIRLRRTLGLAAGFAGMLVILRPDLGIGPGPALTLVSSLLWAMAMTTIRVLGRTESSLASTFYASIFIPLICLPLAIPVWRMPDAGQLGLLAVAAGLGTLATLALTQAFRLAEVGLLMPFDYTKLIWAAVIGWVVFAERPAASALVGGAIILAATSYVAWRETRVGRAAPPAPPPPG